MVVVALTGCTGRGGGQLPPQAGVFNGAASFGFSVSCERSSASTSLNPPAGRLRIQLSYTDHGSNPLGSSFGIHGIVDNIDPVLESQICIGQNSPPEPGPPHELIFLGRYRLTSSAPERFPSNCPASETATTPLCRFEVIVRDNDMNRAPSTADYFQIKLSKVTALSMQFADADVPYTRGGKLSSGNLTVD